MESKTLGFSVNIYSTLVRHLLVKQSLTRSGITTSARPEMFWSCPIWQVLAKLSSPGSWSTSWQVSHAPQPPRPETPAGGLALPLPTCCAAESENIPGAWTPLWFVSGSTRWPSWSGSAGAPAVPDVERWLRAALPGWPSASQLCWSQGVWGPPSAAGCNGHPQICCYCQRRRRRSAAGSGTWELCFDVSEVTFLGISSLRARSKEFVSCLIWTQATNSEKTSFPADWRLGLPGSSSARAPSALLSWWIGFLCPNSRGSAVPWPVRLS